MSISVIKSTYNNLSFFSKLLDMFTGSYTSQNKDIKELKDEILNIEGPGNFKTDKLNMSKDIKNISDDLKIAFEEYKELHNG